MATIDQILVKIIADVLGFKSGMDEAAAKVKTFSAEAEESFARASTAAKSYDQSLMDALAAVDAPAKEAVASMEKVSHATAGVTREIVVLGREAASGRINNLPGSFALLLQRMNALSPAGILAAGAIAGIGYAAYEAIESAEKFQLELDHVRIAMDAVGKGGSFNEGTTTQLIDNLRQAADVSNDSASTIVRSFESMRTVGQDDINQLTELVKNYATATGESTEKAAQSIVKLFGTDSYAALKKLDEQFNLLTPDQLAAADAASKVGDATAQTKIAMEALNELGKRVPEESITPMRSAWNQFTLALSGASDKSLELKNRLNDLAATELAKGGPGAGGKAYLAKMLSGVNDLASRNLPDKQETSPADAARKKALEDQDRLQQQQTDTLKRFDTVYRGVGSVTAQRLQWEQKITEAEEAQTAAIAKGDTKRTAEAQDAIKYYQDRLNSVKEKGAKKPKEDKSDEQFTKLLDQQAAQYDKFNQQEIDGDAKVALEKIKTAEQVIQQKAQLGQISGEQEIAQMLALAAESHSIEEQKFNDLSTLYRNDYARYKALLDEKAIAEQKYTQQVDQLNTKAALAAQQQWQKSFLPIQRAFDTSIQGMVLGTQTFQQAVARMGQSIIAEVVDKAITTMVSSWVSGNATIKAVTTAFDAFFETSTISDSAAAIAAAHAQAAGTIPAYAAEGAAAAFASTAAIPIVGPGLAPAAAAEAYANIMAFEVPSASGGWMVPHDTLAMIHQDERVLPARYSQGLDNMVNNAANGNSGGSSGDVHLHIHAIDTQTGADFIKNNMHEIGKGLQKMIRNKNGKV